MVSIVYANVHRVQNGIFRKKTDFWIHLGDNAEKAYWAVKLGVINANHIFAFSTIAGIEDTVIPVPDYMYYELPMGIKYDDCITEYKKRSEFPWKWNKAFWIGNLKNHYSREKLYKLGEENPDELDIKSIGKDNFVSMEDQYQYKYLIDAKGCGWTDRIKMLFLLKRPIFINERPYVEFWMMNGFEPGKHYILVKEDFSDLLKKKREFDLSPEKYRKMTEEMQAYSEKYLTKAFALEYLREVILRYGVRERKNETT